MPQEINAEIEESRQQALAELNEDAAQHFGPDTMGCHEALHMASVVQDIVERHVLNHPAIVLNPSWYRRAYHASTELAALYQDIGRASSLDRKP